MLDSVSLDQLRMFIAACDEGSFSAAARRLRRSQSVVSQTITNLEAQLGIALFERSGRYPLLTPAGQALLPDARAIAGRMDGLKARARSMADGLEPELSVVVDVMFPMTVITEAARDFILRFPGTSLRLYVETLGGAFQPVMDGRCSLGVVGSMMLSPPNLTFDRLAGVAMVQVAAPSHPLAAVDGVIPRGELVRHVQLVLTDRSNLSAGREFGVLSPLTWRLGDLFAKHMFLLNGLGWGGMPLHAVTEDLTAGRLVRLAIEDMPADGLILPMSVIYPTAAPPGPAASWLIQRLKAGPRDEAA